jgi:hypothetical protein
MHRIRYYAPILHKGRAQQTGTKVDGARQQKCSKDWTDSDEYLGVTMRWGLKREDRIATSTSMLVDAKGDEGGAA